MHASLKPPAELIGSRFQVQRELGRGGMARVFEVNDLQTGEVRALKRLVPSEDAKKQRQLAQLFQREYQELMQLAHPRVVQVCEYALDELGPYYTMELLSGGDLHELAPLPWRRVCAIGRDVCSALSLLHSRQLIHGDVSPRNIRCANDGSAKLFDFGAVAPFGPAKYLVGTPACCAPEVVSMQALHARTDLYALGATLYFTLTGRHAYPARHMSTLAALWREPIAAPSQFVPDIPPALDDLVLSMLHVDPDTRPSSAAEVMQRLSGIDGGRLDESLLVAQAYLSSPTLVGRTKLLARTRARLERALSSQGSALAIEGPSGVGRTRFLDASVLEATLLGLTVVRVDADHAQAGDWGLVRSLSRTLSQLLPEAWLAAVAPQLPVLCHVLPELLSRAPDVTPRELSEAELRPRLHHALRDSLLALSKQRSLVIAVDDLQRVDDSSLAFLALLALELRDAPLVLIATVTSDSAESAADMPACTLFLSHSKRFRLRNLDLGETELLMRSLFGDTAHVGVLGHRLWPLSSGNPRQLMRLAQHLIDQGLVRYRDGAWTLPDELSASDLPLSASQAQELRVARLSPAARELATSFALCPDWEFTIEECAALSEPDASIGTLYELLDELRRAEIVRHVRDDFALAHPTWRAALCDARPPEELAALHRKLAQNFMARPEQAFRVARHSLLAGDVDAALDMLVAHARQSQEQTANNAGAFYRYMLSLPPDWLAIFQQCLQLCRERGRPRRERFVLMSRLAGMLAVVAEYDMPLIHELLRELTYDSGLADWAELDPSLEPSLRLHKALTSAAERHANASPAQQNLAPVAAITQLARAEIAAFAAVALSLDAREVRALPSLAPLVPLSPALGLINLLSEGMCERWQGRSERAYAIYLETIARLDRADRAGLDASHAGYTRMGVLNSLAMIAAVNGEDRACRDADELARDPTHRVNSVRVRMLYHLWQGNWAEAESLKQLAERERIENGTRHWFDGSHLQWELSAYVIAEDLARLKQVREDMAKLARRYPAWAALDHFAAAQYLRGCDAAAAALKQSDAALQLSAAGEHPSWPMIAAQRPLILLQLGRAAEARAYAEAQLARARDAELGYQCEYLRMSLALAQAAQGEADAAVENAELAIAAFQAARMNGLNLGLAYETRARVALALGDMAGFERWLQECRQLYLVHKNPALSAKLERLSRVAERAQSRSPAASADDRATTTTGAEQVRSALAEAGRRGDPQASTMLTLLIENSRAASGFLFVLSDAVPMCSARSEAREPSQAMLDAVRDYVAAELDADASTTASTSRQVAGAVFRDTDGSEYRPVLLSHYVDGELVITAVAMLCVRADISFLHPAELANQLSAHTLDT